MAGLTIGTMNTMVAGQTPVAITSSTGVKAQMMNTLSTDLTGAALNPPLSEADQAYGTRQPRISVPGNGLAACDSGAGYNKMSVAGGGSNTHADASAVRSSPLRFGASTPVPVTASGAKVPLNQLAVLSRLSTLPAYYITMPFAAPMTQFNRTVEALVEAGKRPLLSNFTLPACATYNGVAYVPCRHCNVSSYTSVDVTYACYDMSTLCPTFVKATTSSTHPRALSAVSGKVNTVKGEVEVEITSHLSEEVDMQTLGIQFEPDVFGGMEKKAGTGLRRGYDPSGAANLGVSPTDQDVVMSSSSPMTMDSVGMFQDEASQEFDEDWESLERIGLIDPHVLRALQAARNTSR